MSEYELIDALDAAMSQVWASSHYLTTLITGYLLIAYFLGKQLTTFQVSFLNVVFLSTYVPTIYAIPGHVERVAYLSEQLRDINSDYPYQTIMTTLGLAVPGTYLLGAMLVSGCFIFMWSIRHPKQK